MNALQRHLPHVAVALCTLAALALATAPAASAQSCTISRLFDPHFGFLEENRPRVDVSGNAVALNRAPVTEYEVFYYDNARGDVLQLTDTEPNALALGTSISGMSINDSGDAVYVAQPFGEPTTIRRYRAATGTEEILVTLSATPQGVSQNNRGDVVWSTAQPTGQGGRILLREEATGAVTVLVDDLVNRHFGAVINDRGDVAWSTADSNSSQASREILFRRGATGEIVNLTQNALDDGLPQINDVGQVVWRQIDGTDRKVFLYDDRTGVTRRVAEELTFMESPDVNDRGDVVMTAPSPENNRLEIFLQEADSGALVRITTNSERDIAPHLNDLGEVVWQGGLQNGPATNSVPRAQMYSPTRPIARVGPDQSALQHESVTLDGTLSCDPNGDLLAYRWDFLSVPEGSQAVLADATTPLPSFTLDAPGEYRVRLRVDDGQQVSTAALVSVGGTNQAPIADAGPDQVLQFVNTPVTLDGTGSSDPDDNALTYQWTLSKNLLSSAQLDDPASPTPHFVADVADRYFARLVVTDAFGGVSQMDQVFITFDDAPPVADAGTDRGAVIGTTVTLDGSGSFDPNGGEVFPDWTLVSRPAGSIAWMANPHLFTPSFFADVPGSYVASLVVRDFGGASEPDVVTIEAVSFVDGAVQALFDLQAAIDALPDEAFSKRNRRKQLGKKTNAVLREVDKGNLDKAVDKLERDVLAKMIGCADSGVPAKHDWIATCDAQAQLSALAQAALTALNGALDPPVPPPPPPPGGGSGGL